MSIQPLAVRIEGDLIRVVASDQIISGGGGGTSDHGALTGLADNDHPQYVLTADAAELIRDTIGTALVAGTNITLTVNDAGDTITVAMPGTAFEAAGAVATHAAVADPHPTYTTAAEVTSALSPYLLKLAAGAAVENIGAVEANVNTIAATGATETLDVSVHQVHDCTMDQACTFTFSNPAPAGKCSSFVLILRGAFTPTLPASVDWSGGTAPTYTTPSMYTFTTVDAGTTWLGAQVGKAFA